MGNGGFQVYQARLGLSQGPSQNITSGLHPWAAMTESVWQFRRTDGAEILPTPLSGDRHWQGMTVSAYSITLSSTVRQTPLVLLPRTHYRLQVVC